MSETGNCAVYQKLLVQKYPPKVLSEHVKHCHQCREDAHELRKHFLTH